MKPKSILVDTPAGDVLHEFIQQDPLMTPMRENVRWVLNLNYPGLRLLNGVYYNWTRISPVQVQVLLFDGFDWVLATKEHYPGETKVGVTDALLVAAEQIGDMDERCIDEIWNDLMED